MYRVCGFETRTTDRITYYRYTRAWFTARGIGNRLYNDTGTDHQKSINSIRRYLFAEGASAVIMIILCLRNARIGWIFVLVHTVLCLRAFGVTSACTAAAKLYRRYYRVRFSVKSKKINRSRGHRKRRVSKLLRYPESPWLWHWTDR